MKITYPVRRWLSLVLAVLMLTGCAPAEEPEPTEELRAYEGPSVPQMCLKGAVAHLPDGTLYWHLTCSYDSWGNLREVIRQGADSTVTDALSYTYNEQGRILSRSSQDSLETVRYQYNTSGTRVREIQGMSRTEYTYGSRGNLRMQETYSSDILDTYTTYSYGTNGQLILVQNYDSDGLLLSHVASSYDQQGRLISQRSYTKSGVLPSTVLYEYDENGDLVTVHSLDRSGRLRWYMVYTYDSSGSCLTAARYGGDGKMQWWVEFSYAVVRIPEGNRDTCRSAREEILGLSQ